MGNKNKLPNTPKKEDLVKLFQAVYKPKIVIMFFLGVMLGLRAGEVPKILSEDVDLQRKEIKIRDSKDPNRKKHGGYGKDRMVPIPEIALSPIKKWKELMGGSKWLFPSDKSPDLHISEKVLENEFAEARKRAGLDRIETFVKFKKPVNKRTGINHYFLKYHGLRHFYAQYVFDRTRDLYTVSKLLGHSQITTTEVYARASNIHKRESVDFAFNTPIKTKIFQQNPVNAFNYNLPEIAKREKTPIEIIEERFARGEISDIEYANKIRLLGLRKEYLNLRGNEKEIRLK